MATALLVAEPAAQQPADPAVYEDPRGQVADGRQAASSDSRVIDRLAFLRGRLRRATRRYHWASAWWPLVGAAPSHAPAGGPPGALTGRTPRPGRLISQLDVEDLVRVPGPDRGPSQVSVRTMIAQERLHVEPGRVLEQGDEHEQHDDLGHRPAGRCPSRSRGWCAGPLSTTYHAGEEDVVMAKPREVAPRVIPEVGPRRCLMTIAETPTTTVGSTVSRRRETHGGLVAEVSRPERVGPSGSGGHDRRLRRGRRAPNRLTRDVRLQARPPGRAGRPQRASGGGAGGASGASASRTRAPGTPAANQTRATCTGTKARLI